MGSSSSTQSCCGPRVFHADRELQGQRTGGSLPLYKLDLKVPEGMKAAIIVACGSFSPPTLSHLRIMEDARDCLRKQGVHTLGGFMSPVHAGYGKKSLVDMYHRVNMLTIALADSEWIAVDAWECMQEEWTRTALVMDRFQKELDRLYNDGYLFAEAKALMLGGADLVKSFKDMKADGEPLWLAEDVEMIVTKGMACITRDGFDLDAIVKGFRVLEQNKDNLKLVQSACGEGMSSTLIRKLLREGSSIKYLTHDGVIDYIKDNGLAEMPQWQS